MNFLDLGLSGEVVDILTKLGYTTPTEIQQKAIPVLLKKQDVVGRSETGSGKTFAFGLPIIQNIDKQSKNLQAIVICPTRELAMQDADEIKKVASELKIGVCAVFGGSNMARQIDAIKRKPQILVGTPGRIKDLINKNILKLETINVAVLDEADEMLDMGFINDIEEILSHTNKTRQTVLFSATIPDEIKEIIKKYLSPNSVTIEVGTENKSPITIEQKYIFVDKKHKNDALKQLFLSDVFGKTIVFVNTKRYAENLEKFLRKENIECRAIHGDLRQNDRRKVLLAFKNGKCDILIATDVAARGLDIKDVKYIVNFDLPQQLEYYVHRIGRTARAGESGKVLNLVTSLAELSYMKDIQKVTNATIELFESTNENLKPFIVDTKNLAKENNRFAKKDSEKSFRGNRTKRTSRFAKKDDGFSQKREHSNFGRKFKRDDDKSFSAKRYFDKTKNDFDLSSEDDSERKPYRKRKNSFDGESSFENKNSFRKTSFGKRKFGQKKFGEHRFEKRYDDKSENFNSDSREGKNDEFVSHSKFGYDKSKNKDFRNKETRFSKTGFEKKNHFSKKWDDNKSKDKTSDEYSERKSYSKRPYSKSKSKSKVDGKKTWFNKFTKNK